MKLQNLSVKRLFGRVAMGLVLSMSGITIALFLVTKQTAVLLTGGALLLCALVWIFVLKMCIRDSTGGAQGRNKAGRAKNTAKDGTRNRAKRQIGRAHV